MLIFEQLGFIYNQEKDDSYDKISIARIQKILSGDDSQNYASYIIKNLKDDNKLILTKYNNETGLDLRMIQTDMENSRNYEEIIRMKETNFRANVVALLESTAPEFEGYKLSIKNYLKVNENLSDKDLKE